MPAPEHEPSAAQPGPICRVAPTARGASAHDALVWIVMFGLFAGMPQYILKPACSLILTVARTPHSSTPASFTPTRLSHAASCSMRAAHAA